MKKLTLKGNFEGKCVIIWAITVKFLKINTRTDSCRRLRGQRAQRSTIDSVWVFLFSGALIVCYVEAVAHPANFIRLSLLHRVN